MYEYTVIANKNGAFLGRFNNYNEALEFVNLMMSGRGSLSYCGFTINERYIH